MTEPTAPRTDVDAAAELAAEPSVITAQEGERFLVATPPGWETTEHDFAHLLARPDRPTGIVAVHDAASFVAAVQRRRLDGPEPAIYSNEEATALVAVLNDDEADVAGWRDYRVALGLRQRPEWRHWLSRDGELVNQEAFAEHVDDGLAEIIQPAAMDMLELAQSFHATTNATMKSGARLASGAVQFRYEEQVDAAAGRDGTISVPEVIKLAIAPFYGSARYEVTARFRYRLSRGDLTMGYKLDRPDDVARKAFSDVAAEVSGALPNAAVFAGPAPD